MAKSWKERQEEEARVLAEMETAMKEEAAKKQEELAEEAEDKPCPNCSAMMKDGVCLHCGYTDKKKETTGCEKCGGEMKNGVCRSCGHAVYVPMDEEKKKTVRFIIGTVCIVAFVLFYFVLGK